jgi:hypothetical protein
MCSAASVRSVTGWMTGPREQPPERGGQRGAGQAQREQQPAQARERRVDAGEAPPELERAAARGRHRADPHVVAVDHAVGLVALGLARRHRPVARGDRASPAARVEADP